MLQLVYPAEAVGDPVAQRSSDTVPVYDMEDLFREIISGRLTAEAPAHERPSSAMIAAMTESRSDVSLQGDSGFAGHRKRKREGCGTSGTAWSADGCWR